MTALPQELQFQEDFLANYQPGQNVSPLYVGTDLPDAPEDNLANYVNFCLKLMEVSRDAMGRARRESGTLRRLNQEGLGEFNTPTGEEIAEVSGSIELYGLIKEEMERIIVYSTEKGFASDQWPMHCLARHIATIEEELRRYEERKNDSIVKVIWLGK